MTTKRLLKTEALRELMELTDEERTMLNAIAGGKPPRNAQSILKAIELKLAYAHGRPPQSISIQGGGDPTKPVYFRAVTAGETARADINTPGAPAPLSGTDVPVGGED